MGGNQENRMGQTGHKNEDTGTDKGQLWEQEKKFQW